MVFPFEYIAYLGFAFVKINTKPLTSATDLSQIRKILTQVYQLIQQFLNFQLQDCDCDNVVYSSITLYQQQKSPSTNSP
jgi:hypothetical protein